MTTRDKQIWDLYTREVKPVSPTLRKPSSRKPTSEKAAARKAAEKETPQLPKRKPTGASPDITSTTLERRREKYLRQGEIEIDAKLDLHGMTQAEAFESLASFMQRHTKSGKRYLLVITGKGRNGIGVLKQNLENWLQQLPEAKMILALRSAALKHGGDGAFYVLLKKRK